MAQPGLFSTLSTLGCSLTIGLTAGLVAYGGLFLYLDLSQGHAISSRWLVTTVSSLACGLFAAGKLLRDCAVLSPKP
ncbi:hypothetical protein [Ferrimonas marina]|uniref:hypothetical protein n=1 Tax=Ferrimonas marina TaxID=299255 RepID=UPI000AB0381E|nr:hypothetical protein [Ferrimonas marina]